MGYFFNGFYIICIIVVKPKVWLAWFYREKNSTEDIKAIRTFIIWDDTFIEFLSNSSWGFYTLKKKPNIQFMINPIYNANKFY